jgi:hypothetical protein
MPFYKSFDEMVQALIDPAVLEDARKLMKAGADVELVLLFLRDRGLDQGASITAICALTAMPHHEAKKLVCCSKAWVDHFDSVEHLHDVALKAIRELAASNENGLLRIELFGFYDIEP